MAREKNPTASSPKRRAPAKRAKPAEPAPPAPTFVDPERRAACIAEAAYYRSERRGFAPGHELHDWLDAEAEIDSGLLRGRLEANRA